MNYCNVCGFFLNKIITIAVNEIRFMIVLDYLSKNHYILKFNATVKSSSATSF